MIAAVAMEVEGLKAKLKKANEKVAERKAATEQAAAELKAIKTTSEKHEARVTRV